jgi:hypothetical protein
VTIRFPHLCLRDWPFQVVPSDDFFTFLADREGVARDVRTILRNLSRRDASSIHVIWAWFGAGKTHTLKYMAHVCRSEHTMLLPVYCEFPRDTRSFVDVYRAFVEALDLEALVDAYLEVFTSPRKDEVQRSLHLDAPDLSNALTVLATGTQEQKDSAIRWLRAEAQPLPELRHIGIGRRLSGGDDAVRTLSWLIKLFNLGSGINPGTISRVVWMIDEFQRIEECRPRSVISQINGCLHSIFNRNPNALSIFLSFSGKPQTKMPEWLSPEIKDRIGIERPILLPPLSPDEAVRFVKDLLREFRPDSSSPPSDFYPFEESAVRFIIRSIQQKRGDIKPRNIMQFFQTVLDEADPLIEQHSLGVADSEFAEQCLKDVSETDEKE